MGGRNPLLLYTLVTALFVELLDCHLRVEGLLCSSNCKRLLLLTSKHCHYTFKHCRVVEDNEHFEGISTTISAFPLEASIQSTLVTGSKIKDFSATHLKYNTILHSPVKLPYIVYNVCISGVHILYSIGLSFDTTFKATSIFMYSV